MKSYLLSTLRQQFSPLGFETFKATCPHEWLLWEPGAWKPPARQTMQIFQTSHPPPQGGEALALALPHIGRVVLGRGTECDLVINDGTLSSKHLVFTRAGQSWSVEDAGSMNGTKVNGKQLHAGESVALESGAHIEAAQVMLTFWTPEGLWPRLKAH